MRAPETSPTIDPTPVTGDNPATPPERLALLVRELVRLRGRERGLIRAQADRFVAAVWATRKTDKARQGAIAWALERLLFDHDRL